MWPNEFAMMAVVKKGTDRRGLGARGERIADPRLPPYGRFRVTWRRRVATRFPARRRTFQPPSSAERCIRKYSPILSILSALGWCEMGRGRPSKNERN